MKVNRQLTVNSMVHVAAAGSVAFFSSELCCTSSLLGGEPVSFQLLVILMGKDCWFHVDWISMKIGSAHMKR